VTFPSRTTVVSGAERAAREFRSILVVSGNSRAENGFMSSAAAVVGLVKYWSGLLSESVLIGACDMDIEPSEEKDEYREAQVALWYVDCHSGIMQGLITSKASSRSLDGALEILSAS